MKNFELSQAVSKKLKLPKLNATKVFKGQELIAIHYGGYKVAKKIINDIKKNNPSGGDIEGERTKLYPDFSTDMNTAWVLIEAMKQVSGDVIFVLTNENQGNYASFTWDYGMDKKGVRGQHAGPHAPTVILRAAAKALGVSDE